MYEEAIAIFIQCIIRSNGEENFYGEGLYSQMREL